MTERNIRVRRGSITAREYLYETPPEQDSTVIENFKGGRGTVHVEVIDRFERGFSIDKLSAKPEWLRPMLFLFLTIVFLGPMVVDINHRLSASALTATAWLVVIGALVVFMGVFAIRLLRQFQRIYNLQAVVETEPIGVGETNSRRETATSEEPETDD